MKIKELRTKGEGGLEQMLKEERERLRELEFDLASKKLKKVREVRESKRTIARILTLLGEKRGSGVKAVAEDKNVGGNAQEGGDK